MEKNNTNSLIDLIRIKSDNFKKRFATVCSWTFSNFLAVAFPIGAIWFIETFEKDGQFNITSNYSELLLVAISICVNIILQLNTNEYNFNEWIITFIRVITVGILVISSLAYGISKTIPQDELNIEIVFEISKILCIATFITGILCETKKKWRN